MQGLYEEMQKKLVLFFTFWLLMLMLMLMLKLMASVSCLHSGMETLQVLNIDFVAFSFIVYYQKTKTSGSTSRIHLGPIAEKNKRGERFLPK